MNRRTFLKLTGATVALSTTPLTFAEKKETLQWIKLSDQPDRNQKVVVCHASKWISFKDQLPPHNEEVEVRDQGARIAKGWFAKSVSGDYFMPCWKDKEWLHMNCVEINKLMWSWRYV